MSDRALALVGGTVLDGTGRAPRQATVVLRGDAIVSVDADAAIPADATRFDVSGVTVMPGLIDGHVHLRSYAGAGRSDFHLWAVTTFIEEQTLHAAANARKALLAGVTTVRDMAGGRPEVAVKHVVADGLLDGARVVASGFVGMTAGHGDLFCPPAVHPRPWPTVDGVDACRRLVREYARDGVDLIKICTSGGVLSLGDEADWRNFTADETAAVVDEAHALGKRVAAHAHSRPGIAQALAAGVDTLEHGSSLDDALIEQMRRQGTWLCPTLSINEYILTHGEARGIAAASLAKARALRQGHLDGVRKAHAAGVRIFAGTDSSSTLAFGAHAGELELLQRHAGLTAMEAVLAATRDAADALGLGSRTGTLEPGKWGDVIVVDGDPLADLAILRRQERIRAVFRGGEPLVDRGLRVIAPAAVGR
jgi:imidazolonepropionase-like amidohydrolase